MDFAIVNVAASINIESRVCKNADIVLGVVAPALLISKPASDLLVGKVIDETLAESAAAEAVKGARWPSSNAYKIQIAQTLVKRAILACCNS